MASSKLTLNIKRDLWWKKRLREDADREKRLDDEDLKPVAFVSLSGGHSLGDFEKIDGRWIGTCNRCGEKAGFPDHLPPGDPDRDPVCPAMEATFDEELGYTDPPDLPPDRIPPPSV